MAGFAALHLQLVARIELKHLGVDRVRPVRVFLDVAGDASLLADIARLLRTRRGRKLGHALQRRQRWRRTWAGLYFEIISDLARETEIRTAMIGAGAFMGFAQMGRETAGMVAVGRQSLCSRYESAEQERRRATQPDEDT